MAITNGYTDLATVKTRCSISDLVDDATLEAVITAVSRLIDNYCGRRFYTTTDDETRYFTASDAYELWCGDLLSVTTLETDSDGDRVYEETWAATDYDLEPYNAPLDGQPYYLVKVAPNGNYTFPVGVAKGVKITGKFGYCALANVPAPVAEACIIQSQRLFRRKDAPFGITGAAEFGTATMIARLDPDVRQLLEPYRLVTVG